MAEDKINIYEHINNRTQKINIVLLVVIVIFTTAFAAWIFGSADYVFIDNALTMSGVVLILLCIYKYLA